MRITKLSDEQVACWHRDGYLVIRSADAFAPEVVSQLVRWTTEVQEYPETPGKWMMYFDKSVVDSSRILNRLENFFDYHPAFGKFFRAAPVIDLVSQLFGEPAVLFKEKINFKFPGGAGFEPHQDAQGWEALYDGLSRQISLAVSIDASNRENGCLEMVAGRHTSGLIGPMWAAIPSELVQTMDWQPVSTEPGDLIFFDSYTPHRSGFNLTNKTRRLLYLSYNKASEGDFRERYFADKRKSYPPDCEREAGKEYSYKI